jgi:hypothetical protein
MVHQDNADHPDGRLPKGYPEAFTPERYLSRVWNSGQDRQGTQPTSVIPENPSGWIGLLQSNDLRRHHWKNGDRKPERGRS